MIIKIFKEIAKLNRCSGNTEELENYIIEFSNNYGYSIKRDKYGNILAFKNPPKLAFQSHLDMVCVGSKKVDIIEENGYLKSRDSSLGADNGIGVAIMLYFMTKYDNLELLFTKDEEIGLIGAENLDLKINSKYLINLDSEDENIYIGSAGGFDMLIDYNESYNIVEGSLGKIEIKNLISGHSGVDIDKNIPNAILELLNIVDNVSYLSGGERRNAIPANAFAYKVFKGDQEIKIFDNKYIEFLKTIPHGVLEYDFEYKIPSKSVNFAIINGFNIVISGRANTNKKLEELKEYLLKKLKNDNNKISIENYYSAWDPKESGIAKLLQKIVNKEFKVIHAGLECGILKEKLDVDIVSYGPIIENPHSIRERVNIESIYRVVNNLEELINMVPVEGLEPS